ncbi:cell division protein FtsA [Isobaculum melis]|uniref:Cell division protein FtsA n=1 Tax=Isobaculum melis TaxID=142588 RepID=A0A1H9T6M4_9LACT|nr:cell division protein FtsA [Isobaculum melis]SER92872.1 cell division protein FtsA [Isobaculum melis]
MSHTGVYVSLDIGTTSIKVVVSEIVNGQMNVIGVGNEKSEGLSRGIIVDIDKTVDSIKRAVQQAEQKSNMNIQRVVVGIPTNNAHIESCHGMIAVSGENREITNLDVENVMAAAKVRSVPPEREIISVIPQQFIVDGFEGIKDPRGMIGVRLEMQGTMITGPKTIIHNTKKCVERAGLYIEDLVLQPLALASVALSKGERDFGSIIIDMGGGQTTASVIHDNQLKFTYVDQEGGEYVTKDISVVLNTSLESAEHLKRDYGYALPEETSEQETFPVTVVGKEEPIKVDEHYLSEIIEARLVQIFEKVHTELNSIGAFNLPGGIVLTGGAASLPGVVELAKDIFETNVRLFVPDQMGMRFPLFATGIGLVNYVANLEEIHHVAEGKMHDVAPQNQESRVEVVSQNEAVRYTNDELMQQPKKARQPKEPKPEEERITEKAKGFFSKFFGD